MEHEQEAQKLRESIYRNMSYAEKYRQLMALRACAWQVKKAAVKERHPDWSDGQVEAEVKEIFLYART